MKKSELLQNVLTCVLTLCALVVTALVVRREMVPRAGSRVDGRTTTVAEWRSYVTSAHVSGPPVAPVTLVEFSDFQCPYCRLLSTRLDTLRAEFPRDLKVVFRHYPLPNHAQAKTAALASECAGEQGRFWEMVGALFGGQEGVGSSPWEAYASAAGVRDPAAFARCMGRGDLSRVRSDVSAGDRLRVEATPTLLINDQRLVGAPPLDTLRAYFRRALAAPPAR